MSETRDSLQRQLTEFALLITPDALISWVEGQPEYAQFRQQDPSDCVVAQYATAWSREKLGDETVHVDVTRHYFALHYYSGPPVHACVQPTIQILTAAFDDWPGSPCGHLSKGEALRFLRQFRATATDATVIFIDRLKALALN